QAFFIEGPQVFQAATAPGDDKHLGTARRCPAIDPADHRGDFGGGPVALHADRADPDLDRRPAATENFEHVAHRRPRRTGDERHPPGIARQGLLATWVEIAETLELLLELLKGKLQPADPLGLHLVDDHLVLAVRRIDFDPATDHDRQAVARLETEPLS